MSDLSQTETIEQIKKLLERVDSLKNEEKEYLNKVNSAKLELESVEQSIRDTKVLEENASKQTESKMKTLSTVSKELDALVSTRNSVQQDISILSEQKKQAQIAISAEEAGFKARKLELEKDFADTVRLLEDQAAYIQAEIKSSTEELKNLLTSIENTKKTHEDYVEKIESLKRQEKKLESSINKIEADIKLLTSKLLEKEQILFGTEIRLVQLNKDRNSQEVALNELENSIAEAKTSLKSILKDIENNEAEYNIQSSKLFNIAERERLLEQRIELVKERFKQAGVQWREI
jgi:chromosome segregation ATPase